VSQTYRQTDSKTITLAKQLPLQQSNDSNYSNYSKAITLADTYSRPGDWLPTAVANEGIRNFRLGAIAPEVPSGVQGQSPAGESGGVPQKLKQFAHIIYRF